MPVQPDEFDTRLRLGELDAEQPRAIATPWGEFALFLVAGEPLAVQSFCPHLAGPLFQGTLHGDTITCPWHQWCFSLRTGERLAAPPGERTRLSRCAVRIGLAGTLVLQRPERAPVLP
jgi:nitrite reductase/ring-hydroxylating ferredoxin subunit